MARQLQAELVPQSLPAVPGFELGAFNRVANTVGGDLYEFQPLENGGLAILFGDASGHGMAAGLVMAVAHTAWRLQLERDPAPGEVLATLNRVLCRLGSCRTSGPRQFFAGVALLLQPDGIVRRRGRGAPAGPEGRQVREPSSSASAAAPTPSASSRASPTRSRRGGSARASCSSSTPTGFPRLATRSGREFGDGRVLAVLARTAGRPAADIAAALSGEVLAFLGRRPVGDDVSIAVLRRIPRLSRGGSDPSTVPGRRASDDPGRGALEPVHDGPEEAAPGEGVGEEDAPAALGPEGVEEAESDLTGVPPSFTGRAPGKSAASASAQRRRAFGSAASASRRAAARDRRKRTSGRAGA